MNIVKNTLFSLLFIAGTLFGMEREYPPQLMICNQSTWNIELHYQDEQDTPQSITLLPSKCTSFDLLKNVRNLSFRSEWIGVKGRQHEINLSELDPTDQNIISIGLQDNNWFWKLSSTKKEVEKTPVQEFAERKSQFSTTLTNYIQDLEYEAHAQSQLFGFKEVTVSGPEERWKIEFEGSVHDIVERPTRAIKAVESAIIGLKRSLVQIPSADKALQKPGIIRQIESFNNSLEEARRNLHLLGNRMERPQEFYNLLLESYKKSLAKIPADVRERLGITPQTIYQFIGLTPMEAKDMKHHKIIKFMEAGLPLDEEHKWIIRQLRYFFDSKFAKEEYDAFLEGIKGIQKLTIDPQEQEFLTNKLSEIHAIKVWLSELRRMIEK